MLARHNSKKQGSLSFIILFHHYIVIAVVKLKRYLNKPLLKLLKKKNSHHTHAVSIRELKRIREQKESGDHARKHTGSAEVHAVERLQVISPLTKAPR